MFAAVSVPDRGIWHKNMGGLTSSSTWSPEHGTSIRVALHLCHNLLQAAVVSQPSCHRGAVPDPETESRRARCSSSCTARPTAGSRSGRLGRPRSGWGKPRRCRLRRRRASHRQTAATTGAVPSLKLAFCEFRWKEVDCCS